MTDPRADTIRQALVPSANGHPGSQVARDALAALDGLLADAAEANKRWDEAVEALMRCCKCAVEAKAEARVAALEQERDEAKLGHRRCTAAYAEAREVGDAALARVAALETALREIDTLCDEAANWPESRSSSDEFYDRVSAIVEAALAAPAPAEEQVEDFSSDSAPFEAEPDYEDQVGLDGPFEMETPAAEGQT